MAVNGSAKQLKNRSARGTSVASPVNHEELVFETNTSLRTYGSSSRITSHSSYTNGQLSMQDPPSLTPVQAEESPPDSLHQEVAGNGDIAANQRWCGSTVQKDLASATTRTRRDASTETEPAVLEPKLRQREAADRNAAANKFRPKDVTLKSVDAVKRDQRTRKMTILFVGNIAVGKTSLIGRIRHKQYQLIYNATIDMTPTAIGATVRGQNYVVRLLDTAGEERFKAIMQSFYRHGNGAMVVYDVTDYSSFDQVTDWKLTLHEHCDIDNDIKFPIILLGNKADVRGKHINGSEMADDLNMDGFFKTSAKTGDGITDAVKMMISLIDSKCRDRLMLLSQGGQVITLPNQSDHDQHQKQPRPSRC